LNIEINKEIATKIFGCVLIQDLISCYIITKNKQKIPLPNYEELDNSYLVLHHFKSLKYNIQIGFNVDHFGNTNWYTIMTKNNKTFNSGSYCSTVGESICKTALNVINKNKIQSENKIDNLISFVPREK